MYRARRSSTADKTSSCSGSLKISWKSDANSRAVDDCRRRRGGERGAAGRHARSGRCRRRAAASARASAARARAPPAPASTMKRDQPRRDPVVDERIGAVRRRRRPASREIRLRRRGRCRRRGSASAGRASRAARFWPVVMPMSSAGDDSTSASTSRRHGGRGVSSAPATKRAATRPPRLWPSSTSGPRDAWRGRRRCTAARSASRSSSAAEPAALARARAVAALVVADDAPAARIQPRRDVRVAADVLAEAVDDDNRSPGAAGRPVAAAAAPGRRGSRIVRSIAHLLAP